MAYLFEIENAREGYLNVLETLLAEGRIQESRNGRTVELEDVAIQIDNPHILMDSSVRAGYNVAIGYVEGIQLLAGISDSAFTAQVQPNFRNYMEEDTGKFWGAYGPRLVDQLPVIAERLRVDPDTRQAVMTLWDPEFDAHGGKRDHPCTNRMSFRVRDGKLNMTVDMRSNDAWWGFPYDIVQFSMLHQSMADVLGWNVGSYVHKADSFHLYESHWDIARQSHEFNTPSPVASTSPVVPYLSGNSWEEIKQRANVVYRVASQTLPVSELETAQEKIIAETLLKTRKKHLDKTLERF